jgi:hypothetical protein
MPYVKKTWADGPAGNTPILAADLTHLETQYDQATADAAAAPVKAHTHPAADITTQLAAGQLGTGTPSASTVLRGDSTWGAPPAAAPAPHTHPAADVVSGVLAPARLGSGTPDATTYLRGDGAWSTPPAGGGGAGVPPPSQMPFVGGWLGPYGADTYGAGSVALASGAWLGSLIAVRSPITIDALGFRISVGQAVLAKALLYAADPVTGLPLTLVASAILDCVAAGAGYTALGTPVALPAGIYWGFIRSNGGSTVRFNSCRQSPISAVADGPQFVNMGSPPASFLLDVGSYAAPDSPIIASKYQWQYDLNGANFRPIIYMRRSA